MRPIFCECGKQITMIYAETCNRCRRSTMVEPGADSGRGPTVRATDQPAHVLARLGDGEPPDWQARAACIGAPSEMFFPERGESTAFAKEYCDGCPVAAECLEYALTTRQQFGIWGGKSERERRRIRARRGMREAS